MPETVFFGQIIHSKSFDELETISNGFLAVCDGVIQGIGNFEDFESWNHECKSSLQEVHMNKHQFLMPGFIDCHIHAPQMPNIGLGLDKPLLEWLDTYTFPLESKYRDVEFARKIYQKVVRNCLDFGTTTACYFATIHKEASEALVEECISQGQRAFIGKVNMNMNAPDFYIETLHDSVKNTEDFVEFTLGKNNKLVQPVITPRFAITCDESLMKSLAAIAKNHNLLIQSHISENLNEISFVKELFPKAGSYANVYKECGLLTEKTIMAHCCHLENDELDIFRNTGTSAIHCPTSNSNLSSGLCDVRRIQDSSVRVGLGSDISGGNKVGIFDVMRHALDVSQHLKFIKQQEIKGTGKLAPTEKNSTYVPMNYKNVFYLATQGGADSLSIGHKVGNFIPGKEFDALMIDTSLMPIIDYEIESTRKDGNEILDKLEKFIYVGDDRNIIEVYVNGKEVKKNK
ncbi:guanine deaminase [Culicoides brevitarsis]|uniref:guanine deaminase n=1 Tax=Culicoides brevitarsis TaxID=469753 RepID=UPI00307BA13F